MTNKFKIPISKITKTIPVIKQAESSKAESICLIIDHWNLCGIWEFGVWSFGYGGAKSNEEK